MTAWYFTKVRHLDPNRGNSTLTAASPLHGFVREAALLLHPMRRILNSFPPISIESKSPRRSHMSVVFVHPPTLALTASKTCVPERKFEPEVHKLRCGVPT